MLYFQQNLVDWFRKEWWQYLLDNPGEERPQPQDPHLSYAEDDDRSHWWLYNEANCDLRIDPPPQVLFRGEHWHWWIVRMEPGDQMCLHQDPHTAQSHPVQRRYWMPLQDPQPGQVFCVGDQMIDQYRAYDLYRFSDPTLEHGAVNLGHQQRYTLMFTVIRP